MTLFPRTYRNRLLFYTSLLIIFLVVVLGYSYQSSRSAILEQANRNVTRITQQITGYLVEGSNKLNQQVRMISDNHELSEYMFIVVNVDTDSLALHKLTDRLFGWLPRTKMVIVSSKGDVLHGNEYSRLAEVLKNQIKYGINESTFYHSNDSTIELVSTAPIYYQKEHIGTVAIAELLDKNWMIKIARQSSGDLFIVRDGAILQSTLGEMTIGNKFHHDEGYLTINDAQYLVRPISLENTKNNTSQLWLGLSEKRLISELEESRRNILLISLFGIIAIIAAGTLIFRNFTTPLSQLIEYVDEIEHGVLPEIAETKAVDEMGVLRNHFARMVSSLKEKQGMLKEIHTKLEEQAATDPLTDLYNRRHLYDLFPKLLSEANRAEKGVVVLLCDLDKFKSLNDKYGHLAGDEGLKHFARILKICSRTSDFLFRMGGEEFLVLSIGELKGGMILAEKIRSSLEQTPLIYEGESINMTVSIGASYTNSDGEDEALSRVIREADTALYVAKDGGRNCIGLGGTLH